MIIINDREDRGFCDDELEGIADSANARPWEKDKLRMNFREQLMVVLGAVGASVLIWMVFAVAGFVLIFMMTSYFQGLL